MKYKDLLEHQSNESVIVDNAFNLAKIAHHGQFRRDGVTPYFNHPKDVARRVTKHGYKYIVVAYLHDVLEDTKTTANDLFHAGFDEEIIAAVTLLTKDDKLSYNEYLALIKANDLARVVKVADMLSNLADDPNDKQITRYVNGISYLIQ